MKRIGRHWLSSMYRDAKRRVFYLPIRYGYYRTHSLALGRNANKLSWPILRYVCPRTFGTYVRTYVLHHLTHSLTSVTNERTHIISASRITSLCLHLDSRELINSLLHKSFGAVKLSRSERTVIINFIKFRNVISAISLLINEFLIFHLLIIS